VSSADFDDELHGLKSSLDQTITLLREHGERHWLSWAERCRHELDVYDAAAFDHILGAYGGMGGFTDLLNLGRNEHLVEPEREADVNDRLGHLRTAIWTTATALRHELRQAPFTTTFALMPRVGFVFMQPGGCGF
jgi:Domain of unknown function (DUF6966)